jgi:hypothetical protein
MREKPEVGQTLYSLNVGNAARGCEQKLTPVIVAKVGRKYFTCSEEDSWFEAQYHLDSWRQKTDYCASSQLYTSIKEWEDERDAAVICRKIVDAFQYGKNHLSLPLDVLRKIDALIEDDNV